jgi:hypothetical protein
MAFKWTKAARAKLSRSQKARWKERKRQLRRKRPKRSSDSAIGVIKIALPSLTDRRVGSLTLEYGQWCRPKRKAPACYSTGSGVDPLRPL